MEFFVTFGDLIDQDAPHRNAGLTLQMAVQRHFQHDVALAGRSSKRYASRFRFFHRAADNRRAAFDFHVAGHGELHFRRGDGADDIAVLLAALM